MLEYMNARKTPATLSEVAYHTGATRAASRRFLLTLESLGYVESNDRLFSLTPKVLKLSSAFSTSRSLASVATPYLKELARLTGESCSVAVLQGENIVYVGRESTKRIMSINIQLGAEFPAVYTSMGRAILANLAEEETQAFMQQVTLEPVTNLTITDKTELHKRLTLTRKRGYSLVNQELEIGLVSLAVPVFDHARNPIAAINIACSTAVHKPNRMVSRFVELLKETSAAITTALEN